MRIGADRHQLPAAFHEARRRSLRRHAIETGIIERLYEVDWGVTQALVAEGITADAVARAGDGALPMDVLQTIQTQYEALEFLGKPTLSWPIGAVTVAILGTAGLLAGYFPAREASRLDPVVAMKL